MSGCVLRCVYIAVSGAPPRGSMCVQGRGQGGEVWGGAVFVGCVIVCGGGCGLQEKVCGYGGVCIEAPHMH